MKLRFSASLLVAVTLALAACERGPELVASSAPPVAEGEASAAFQPITDVPIPEGARLDTERSLVLGGEDNWTGRLVFSVGESSADAFALYHQDMQRFGWRLITSVQAESSVLTFSQGERVATIQIEGRTLSGATVAITMSPRHADGGSSVQVTPLGE
jgi:hypothetical protein